MVRALQELLDARKKRLKRTVRKAAREGETAPVGTALDSVPLKIDETFWQREDRIRLVTGALEGARVENSEQRASSCRPHFDAAPAGKVPQDVGRNFGPEDWVELFARTGAMAAHGYMTLPYELIFDVVPQSKFYSFRRETRAGIEYAIVTWRNGV